MASRTLPTGLHSYHLSVSPFGTKSHSVVSAGFKIVVPLLHLLSTGLTGLPPWPAKLFFMSPLLLMCEGGCGTHKRMGLSGAVEAEELGYTTTKVA